MMRALFLQLTRKENGDGESDTYVLIMGVVPSFKMAKLRDKVVPGSRKLS